MVNTGKQYSPGVCDLPKARTVGFFRNFWYSVAMSQKFESHAFKLSDGALDEFGEIYRDEFGEELGAAAVKEIAPRFLRICDLVLRERLEAPPAHSHSEESLLAQDLKPDRGKSLTETIRSCKLTMLTKTMKTLGVRIRELREERDLSLREFAGKLKLSPAFVSDVELGRRFPSDKVLAEMATILNTSREELVKFDTRPPVEAMKRITTSNPAYGLAFRRVIDQKVSPEALMKFADQNAGDKKKQ